MWNSDLVVNLVRLNKGVRFGCDGLHVALLHSATGGENKLSFEKSPRSSTLRCFISKPDLIYC